MNSLTKEQAIVITGFTGFSVCHVGVFLEDLEKRIGYPVLTHQLADKDFMDEVKELYREDFVKLCYKGKVKMKLLPKEPTNEMIDAAVKAVREADGGGCEDLSAETLEMAKLASVIVYKAMYQVAPEVEQEPYAYATLWDNGEWSVVQEIDKNAVIQVPLYIHQQPKA